jgi:uncharacterized protein (TIGR00730 family)
MEEQKRGFGLHDAVLLSEEEEMTVLLSGAIQGLWDVVNQLTRVQRTTRSNYRVTVFGSARLQPHTPAYAEVRRLAADLTTMGCDIVTGGGPGLMQAANEGAASVDRPSGARSMGIRIELPFEQSVNPYVGEAHEHRTFFSRLHHFALVSDAFIVTPGGVGSLLELSLAWQLLQVGQMHDMPLILVGDLWRELLDWGRRNMLVEGHELASPEDFAIPQCVSSIEDAVASIRVHRGRWLVGQAEQAEKAGRNGRRA